MPEQLIPERYDNAFGVSLLLCLVGIPLMRTKGYRDIGILLTGAGIGGTINIMVNSTQDRRVTQWKA